MKTFFAEADCSLVKTWKVSVHKNLGGNICFIIIREIRRANSSIYIFFKVFRHGIMVLIKNQLCLLERAVKSYEAII